MRYLAISALSLLTVAAHAQTWSQGEAMFSMLNVSGTASPDLNFTNDSSDEIFINSFGVNPSSSGAGLFTVNQGRIFGPSGAFNFGDSLQPGEELFAGGSDGFFDVTLDAPVSSGFYGLDIDIFGGTSSSASDFLYTLSISIETVDDFGLTYSAPNPVRNLGPGESTVLSLDSVNTSNRDFRVNSQYFSWNSTGRDAFDISFLANPGTIAAGSSESNVHLLAKPIPGFEGGSFTFRMGYYGGYYSDDFNFLPGSNQVTLNSVVPEPASMIALSMAAGGLLLRRRKR